MKIDKGQISGMRLMYALVCYIHASALMTAFFTSVAKQDSWLVALTAIILCTLLMWLYRTLMVMFPDLNLLQMLEKVFGKVAGKILSLVYLWFFFTLASLVLMDLGNLAKLTIMEEMPALALLLMSVLVSTYAVRNGIRAVTWYGALFMTISIVILIISVFLVGGMMKFENFMPILQIPTKKYIQSVHICSTIPFGELVAFLMITANVKMSRRGATKYIFWGFILGGLMLLTVVARDISVLGNTMSLFELPSLITLRMVHIGDALSRMEILFAIVLVMLLFFKVMFLHYVCVISISQIVQVKAYRYLVLVTGVFLIAYGLTLFDSPVVHTAYGRETTPVIWSLPEIVIPLLTLIVAKLRKLPAKKEA